MDWHGGLDAALAGPVHSQHDPKGLQKAGDPVRFAPRSATSRQYISLATATICIQHCRLLQDLPGALAAENVGISNLSGHGFKGANLWFDLTARGTKTADNAYAFIGCDRR